MHVFHHRLYSFPLTLLLIFGISLGSSLRADTPLKKLSAIAREVTASPGASELGQRYGSLSEDEFPMRFQLLKAAPMAHWEKLDLTTQSRNLLSVAGEGTVTITLPNGGTCVVRLVHAKDREAVYELTFSSVEVGLAITVPVKTGNVLLLGSPQNNSHDVSFVLIVITPPVDR